MHARALDRRDVNEHIRAAAVLHDKAVALLGIEELNGTCGHHGLLIKTRKGVDAPYRMGSHIRDFACSWGKAVKAETARSGAIANSTYIRTLHTHCNHGLKIARWLRLQEVICTTLLFFHSPQLKSRTRRANGSMRSRVSVRCWPRPWLPVSLIRKHSGQDATSQPGLVWYRSSIPAEAKKSSAVSASKVIAICAACSPPARLP